MNYTAKDYSEIVTGSPIGPMLIRSADSRVQALKTRLRSSFQPIGKLIMQRRSEEVAEFDGKNGARSWITIGFDVYDITSKLYKNEIDDRAWSGKFIRR